MNMEDLMGYEDSSPSCIVCGKGLRPGEATVKLCQGERKLPICCPLCLEAYQKDPQPYLDRFAKRALLRELRNPAPNEGAR
jgi:hypothetical protein